MSLKFIFPIFLNFLGLLIFLINFFFSQPAAERVEQNRAARLQDNVALQLLTIAYRLRKAAAFKQVLWDFVGGRDAVSYMNPLQKKEMKKETKHRDLSVINLFLLFFAFISHSFRVELKLKINLILMMILVFPARHSRRLRR